MAGSGGQLCGNRAAPRSDLDHGSPRHIAQGRGNPVRRLVIDEKMLTEFGFRGHDWLCIPKRLRQPILLDEPGSARSQPAEGLPPKNYPTPSQGAPKMVLYALK